VGADGIFFTADDGLMPAKGSALIDSGMATTPPLPQDMLGQTRIGTYDIGAFEYGHQLSSSVSVALHAVSGAYSVYPNPASGRFFLGGAKDASYSVLAADGRLLLHGHGEAVIDLSNQSPGIYLLLLRDDRTGGSTTLKLIRQQ
jgi:hypothetical protein